MTSTKDVENWKRTQFAKFADDKPYYQQKKTESDPILYNTYTFELTSSERQYVYISLYTYGQIYYPGECYSRSDTINEKYLRGVFIRTSRSTDLQKVELFPGVYHFDKVKMNLDEEPVRVEVYTHFSEDDLLPHDWRLVVIGQESEVEIKLVEPQTNRGFWILITVLSSSVILCVGCCMVCSCYINKKVAELDDKFKSK